MATLLFLDTSAHKSLVMLIKNDEVIAKRSNENQSTHGQVINNLMNEVLEESNISWHQINGVCVLNGPGSYTGLRIALATAKGICYAQEIPLMLINKFDLIYAIIADNYKENIIYITRKAREDEYITAVYLPQNEVMEAQLYSQTELLSKINETNGHLFIEEEGLIDLENALFNAPQKTDIARLCHDYYQKAHFADLFLSEPFYMKNVFINKINKL